MRLFEILMVKENLEDKFDFVVDPGNSVYVWLKGRPHDINKSIAWLGLDPGREDGTYEVTDAWVHDFYQKQGIATEMYRKMAATGTKLVKSNDVTAKGQNMWRSFHRKGLAKDNKFVSGNAF